METNQYMEMFLDESREHLQSLNDGLLSLENDPEDLSVLNEIFRNAHTLKGMSATMGYTKTAELTHDMENLLDMLRKEQLKVSSEIIDVIFKCVDTLQEMVENIGSGESEDLVDVSDLVRQVNAIAKGESPSAEAPAEAAAPAAAAPAGGSPAFELSETDRTVMKEAKNSGLVPFIVHVEISENCLLKSARSYMVMNALDDIGDVIKSVPPAEDLEQEKFDHSFEVAVVTDSDAKAVESAVGAISEISKVVVTEITDLDAPVVGGGAAPAPAEAAPAAPAAAPAAKAEPPKKDAKAADPKKDAKKAHVGGQSVRVDIEKLDTLMNLVGELVTNKVRLEQIGMTHRLTELTETLEQMDRVTTDLQSVVMKVRMVPVSQVFNRFPRMVRDLAKELNKDINLTIEGEETELDRTVIDEIGDPLMHLLRNSLDHGVEHPDEREAKGKPRTGEVGLIARHEGNNVVIMVTDDGAGINADKIRNKAVEKGMVTRDEADALPDADAVRLIFLPGFSTAETITDVSGRGVGMDVVRSKIESLGGHVDVETKIDEGSVFKIKLPLTLAIIQAMLVKVQNEMYAIPLGSIDSTINITPNDIKTVQNKEVIVLRGQIIPIARLGEVLSVPKGEDSGEEDIFVVVVHVGDHKIGIVVDNLIGQQEIVIKTLGKLLSGLKMLAGATVLGDGHVAMILDVSALM
ncbi:MAG: chemotaxis protein CheA [Anaerovibrio sp.]|jgi:two-component system chemotaxis sensor kinase CheA|uniref:chemotaxis protein CheA n=1 Tax=Anaerovibrio sp. TaxID=1872532 RepID=UPI0025BC6F12|nr:chemotaxis protein CheA [Anaerovibrio sp.]MBE6099031.1 chemotaxis protein CheA [Anaerovibrio sp.]